MNQAKLENIQIINLEHNTLLMRNVFALLVILLLLSCNNDKLSINNNSTNSTLSESLSVLLNSHGNISDTLLYNLNNTISEINNGYITFKREIDTKASTFFVNIAKNIVEIDEIPIQEFDFMFDICVFSDGSLKYFGKYISTSDIQKIGLEIFNNYGDLFITVNLIKENDTLYTIEQWKSLFEIIEKGNSLFMKILNNKSTNFYNVEFNELSLIEKQTLINKLPNTIELSTMGQCIEEISIPAPDTNVTMKISR